MPNIPQADRATRQLVDRHGHAAFLHQPRACFASTQGAVGICCRRPGQAGFPALPLQCDSCRGIPICGLRGGLPSAQQGECLNQSPGVCFLPVTFCSESKPHRLLLYFCHDQPIRCLGNLFCLSGNQVIDRFSRCAKTVSRILQFFPIDIRRMRKLQVHVM